MAIAWVIVCHIVEALAPTVDPVLTEGTGGKHKTGSLHYVGLAIDVRSRTIDSSVKSALLDTIKRSLGAEFDVGIEFLGMANEHIHIEFQPK